MSKHIFLSKILIQSILVLTSCEMSKQIDFDTFYGGDKIVIHGYISPQDGVRVIIKKTVPPNALELDDKLQDVIVNLFEDGFFLTNLSSVDGYLYVSGSDFSINQAAVYAIEVVAYGLPTAISEAQPIICSVAIDSTLIVVNELTNYATISVFFNHKNLNNESYYLKAFHYLDGELDTTEFGSTFFHFAGVVNTAAVGVNEIFLRIGQASHFDSLQVRLYTLSPDLRKFLKSYNSYDLSWDDPFFEQTYPVFSNINGGYGIFASYSYSAKTINKKK